MPRRLPRDISGEALIGKLAAYGYIATRQSSSHVRLTRSLPEGDQHLTIPLHKSLRIGTLNGILNDVATQIDKQKAEIVDELFG